MGLITTSDVKSLLQDEEFKADIAKAIAEDPQALDDLAEAVADELGDELENDSALKAQIIEAAMANPNFKKKLVKELIDDLD